MAQLHDLTMLAQADAVRRREVTARELVEHYLARIAAHDPQLGAFVTVTAAAARAEADAIDAAAAQDPAQLPALAGVPVAIKDLSHTSGVRTSFGSRAFADHVPTLDSDVVVGLRAAGTVSLGKTATSEFGNSLYCETDSGTPVRNPWDMTKVAGGSSGGAAAAVAAGLVAAAHGSGGGGSVRIPAAICGLVGVKPSRGVVPGGPLGFGAFGMATDGPLARTVTDAAGLLDAMAVPTPGEPQLAPPPPPGGYLAAARAATPGRCRIGRWTTPVLAETDVDPQCLAAVDAVANDLVEAGHEVVEVAPPIDPGAREAFRVVWKALSVATPVPPERESRLLPITRWLRERGRQVSVSQLLAALAQVQSEVRAGARRLAGQGVQLLLSPTLAAPQAPLDWFRGAAHPAEDFDRQARFSPFCAAYNLTGAPAVSLPVAQTAAGAPIGVMLAAAPGDDGRLLALAGQLEQRSSWRDRHPPGWSAPASATVNGG